MTTPALNTLVDIPAADYHADPIPGGSLSSTTARKMLPPSCPARARWEAGHRTERAAFDLGHAAHTLVLGKGERLQLVDAPDWRSKDARDARDAAYAAGHVPLLPDQMDAAKGMAHAVLTHPVAGPLFTRGVPELAVFWHDHEYGDQAPRRAMFDWLDLDRGRVVDVKTCDNAARDALQRSVVKYGYHQQEQFYLDGLTAAAAGGDAAFLFVFVEKDPPHPVRVVQLADDLAAIGAARNRRAIDRWVWCRETGVWPGHSDTDIDVIGAPKWAAAGGDQ